MFSGSDDLWPILLAFSAVPGFLVSFFLPFVPESPRYLLIKKNEEDKAKDGMDKTSNMHEKKPRKKILVFYVLVVQW